MTQAGLSHNYKYVTTAAAQIWNKISKQFITELSKDFPVLVCFNKCKHVEIFLSKEILPRLGENLGMPCAQAGCRLGTKEVSGMEESSRNLAII